MFYQGRNSFNEGVTILKKIVVDCERNDPVDIRCGGPDYLGFDFYVKDEEVGYVTPLARLK